MNLIDKRALKIAKKLIRLHQLDLSGLSVYTEAASGAYVYPALVCALAGAKKVICYTKNSSYATADLVIEQTLQLAQQWNVDGQINIEKTKDLSDFAQVDIITNSGFVRPLNNEIIQCLKETAVIPLMWETWEFRAEDIDLNACKEKGILVLGTNEHEYPCDMAVYCGFMAMKLLFELGIEGPNSQIILLGEQPTLGAAIYNYLTSVGCHVDWFGKGNRSRSYKELNNFINKECVDLDVIICAEHKEPEQLIGRNGYISFSNLRERCPDLRLGVIAGNLDISELTNSGLMFYPPKLRQFGYMSYMPDVLGPMPVLHLYIASMKVAEVMAKSRRKGMDIKSSTRFALENSPAMDFEGQQSWLNT